MTSEFRCSDLVLPVVRHLGYDRCAVLYVDAKVAALLPAAACCLDVRKVMRYDKAAWRRDYGRFWRELKPKIKRIIRQYDLPPRLYSRLAVSVVICTQQVAGLLEFLRAAEPAVVLTEYDRNGIWAPLVLSARALGIPTYTLVHGTQGERCNGFYPLLADAVFCWGKADQDKFRAAGVAPERTLLGGCPRLTRELSVSPAAARTKMGLDPGRPVVTLGTVMYRQHRMKLAAAFCQAAQGQDAFQAVVRLHPVENLAEYASLAAEFPNIKFTSSSQYTLDEVLAASDIVVVHSSGLGSDALVKRRLTVVLDAIDFPLGHGQDLIDLGGCPRARSADELRSILLRTLGDAECRRRLEQCRETFVASFCRLLRRNVGPADRRPRAGRLAGKGRHTCIILGTSSRVSLLWQRSFMMRFISRPRRSA